MAGIARNVVLVAGIANCQLAAATPAANETGKQRVTVPRRAVMFAVGDIVAVISWIASERPQVT